MIRRHEIILEAATPIAHGDTHSAGRDTNTRLFMRQARLIDGVSVPCPHVSENALRHSLFREPLADHLLSVLGLENETLPRAAVNLLYSGGQMGGVSLSADTVVLGHQVKRLYPSLDLLGGAVDAFILPRGRLKLGAWIVAYENAGAIEALFGPALAADARKSTGHELLWDETRVRGAGERTNNQMIYGYETLAAGARIAIEVTLDGHTSNQTAAALAVALEHWDGFIGGQSRQGRGRMLVERSELPVADAYLQHIEANAPVMREGLLTGKLGTERVLCA